MFCVVLVFSMVCSEHRIRRSIADSFMRDELRERVDDLNALVRFLYSRLAGSSAFANFVHRSPGAVLQGDVSLAFKTG